MADSAGAKHAAVLKESLANGKYSDLTITCGGDTHKVHKIIVCPRSGFFERAERFGKESTEGLINLPDDEPAIISVLLEFLYTSGYEPYLPAPPRKSREEQLRSQVPKDLNHVFPHTCTQCCQNKLCPHHVCHQHFGCRNGCKSFVCELCCQAQAAPERPAPAGGPEQLLLHSKLYTIAEKYDVPGLKLLAKEKFDRSCIAFGQQEDFIVAAEHAFTTTPDEDDGLRKIIQKTLVLKKKTLHRPDVQAFLEARPVLMYQVLLLTTQ